MPKAVRWFLIAIAILVAGRVAVLADYQWATDQQQATCRAQAMKQYGIVTGWMLPAAYPSHYDATLGTCTFFYQSFPPKTAVPKDVWADAITGDVLAEEDSPGNAFKETCYFQNAEIDCADFERMTNQLMTQ